MGAAARAGLGHLVEVGEGLDEVLRLHVREAEGADAGGVDDPALGVGQLEQVGAGGGVPAAAGHRVDDPDLAVGVGHERVDQRRLAHAAVPDQHAGASPQPVAQLGEVAGPLALELGHHPRHPEGAVGRQQHLGVGQVGLGQAQQRRHPGVVRRHEGPVDEARARLGIGQGGDHDELVGVGDDHPLDGVVVVGGATQGGGAWDHLHDPGQRAVGPAGVTDDPHVVADHDPLAAQGARLHRHHAVSVEQEREASAVDRDDAGVDRVVVARPVLGARSGAAPGALVVLVVVLAVAAGRHADPPRTAVLHAVAKSGNVLDVVAMSSTSTSSTARPRMTPAWAMRWSA